MSNNSVRNSGNTTVMTDPPKPVQAGSPEDLYSNFQKEREKAFGQYMSPVVGSGEKKRVRTQEELNKRRWIHDTFSKSNAGTDEHIETLRSNQDKNIASAAEHYFDDNFEAARSELQRIRELDNELHKLRTAYPHLDKNHVNPQQPIQKAVPNATQDLTTAKPLPAAQPAQSNTAGNPPRNNALPRTPEKQDQAVRKPDQFGTTDAMRSLADNFSGRQKGDQRDVWLNDEMRYRKDLGLSGTALSRSYSDDPAELKKQRIQLNNPQETYLPQIKEKIAAGDTSLAKKYGPEIAGYDGRKALESLQPVDLHGSKVRIGNLGLARHQLDGTFAAQLANIIKEEEKAGTIKTGEWTPDRLLEAIDSPAFFLSQLKGDSESAIYAKHKNFFDLYEQRQKDYATLSSAKDQLGDEFDIAKLNNFDWQDRGLAIGEGLSAVPNLIGTILDKAGQAAGTDFFRDFGRDSKNLTRNLGAAIMDFNHDEKRNFLLSTDELLKYTASYPEIRQALLRQAQTREEKATIGEVPLEQFLLDAGLQTAAEIYSPTGKIGAAQRMTNGAFRLGQGFAARFPKAAATATEILSKFGDDIVASSDEGRRFLGVMKATFPQSRGAEVAHTALTFALANTIDEPDRIAIEDIKGGFESGAIFGLLNVSIGRAAAEAAQRYAIAKNGLAKLTAAESDPRLTAELGSALIKRGQQAYALAQVPLNVAQGRVTKAWETGEINSMFDYSDREFIADLMFGAMFAHNDYMRGHMTRQDRAAFRKAVSEARNLQEVADHLVSFEEMAVPSVPDEQVKAPAPEPYNPPPARPARAKKVVSDIVADLEAQAVLPLPETKQDEDIEGIEQPLIPEGVVTGARGRATGREITGEAAQKAVDAGRADGYIRTPDGQEFVEPVAIDPVLDQHRPASGISEPENYSVGRLTASFLGGNKTLKRDEAGSPYHELRDLKIPEGLSPETADILATMKESYPESRIYYRDIDPDSHGQYDPGTGSVIIGTNNSFDLSGASVSNALDVLAHELVHKPTAEKLTEGHPSYDPEFAGEMANIQNLLQSRIEPGTLDPRVEEYFFATPQEFAVAFADKRTGIADIAKRITDGESQSIAELISGKIFGTTKNNLLDRWHTAVKGSIAPEQQARQIVYPPMKAVDRLQAELEAATLAGDNAKSAKLRMELFAQDFMKGPDTPAPGPEPVDPEAVRPFFSPSFLSEVRNEDAGLQPEEISTRDIQRRLEDILTKDAGTIKERIRDIAMKGGPDDWMRYVAEQISKNEAIFPGTEVQERARNLAKRMWFLNHNTEDIIPFSLRISEQRQDGKETGRMFSFEPVARRLSNSNNKRIERFEPKRTGLRQALKGFSKYAAEPYSGPVLTGHFLSSLDSMPFGRVQDVTHEISEEGKPKYLAAAYDTMGRAGVSDMVPLYELAGNLALSDPNRFYYLWTKGTDGDLIFDMSQPLRPFLDQLKNKDYRRAAWSVGEMGEFGFWHSVDSDAHRTNGKGEPEDLAYLSSVVAMHRLYQSLGSKAAADLTPANFAGRTARSVGQFDQELYKKQLSALGKSEQNVAEDIQKLVPKLLAYYEEAPFLLKPFEYVADGKPQTMRLFDLVTMPESQVKELLSQRTDSGNLGDVLDRHLRLGMLDAVNDTMHWLTDPAGGQRFYQKKTLEPKPVEIPGEGAVLADEYKFPKLTDKYNGVLGSAYPTLRSFKDMLAVLPDEYRGFSPEEWRAYGVEFDGDTPVMRMAVMDFSGLPEEYTILEKIFGEAPTDGASFILNNNTHKLLSDILGKENAGSLKTAWTQTADRMTQIHKTALHKPDSLGIDWLAGIPASVRDALQFTSQEMAVLDTVQRLFQAMRDQNIPVLTFSSTMKGAGNFRNKKVLIEDKETYVDHKRQPVDKELREQAKIAYSGSFNIPEYMKLQVPLTGDNGLRYISASVSNTKTRAPYFGLDKVPHYHPGHPYGQIIPHATAMYENLSRRAAEAVADAGVLHNMATGKTEFSSRDLRRAGSILQDMLETVREQEESGEEFLFIDPELGIGDLIADAIDENGNAIPEKIAPLYLHQGIMWNYAAGHHLLGRTYSRMLENAEKGKTIGTMATLMPPIMPSMNLRKLVAYEIEQGADPQLTIEKYQKIVKEDFNEDGTLTANGKGVILSRDILDKLSERIGRRIGLGERILFKLAPNDDPSSLVAMRIAGLSDTPNTVQSNSEFLTGVIGRDFDFDSMGIMIDSPEWRDKAGVNHFDELWKKLDTMTIPTPGGEKGLREGGFKWMQEAFLKGLNQISGGRSVASRMLKMADGSMVPTKSFAVLPQSSGYYKAALEASEGIGTRIAEANNLAQALLNIPFKDGRAEVTSESYRYELDYDPRRTDMNMFAYFTLNVDKYVPHDIDIDKLLYGTFIRSVDGTPFSEIADPREIIREFKSDIVPRYGKTVIKTITGSGTFERMSKAKQDRYLSVLPDGEGLSQTSILARALSGTAKSRGLDPAEFINQPLRTRQNIMNRIRDTVNQKYVNGSWRGGLADRVAPERFAKAKDYLRSVAGVLDPILDITGYSFARSSPSTNIYGHLSPEAYRQASDTGKRAFRALLGSFLDPARLNPAKASGYFNTRLGKVSVDKGVLEIKRFPDTIAYYAPLDELIDSRGNIDASFLEAAHSIGTDESLLFMPMVLKGFGWDFRGRKVAMPERARIVANVIAGLVSDFKDAGEMAGYLLTAPLTKDKDTPSVFRHVTGTLAFPEWNFDEIRNNASSDPNFRELQTLRRNQYAITANGPAAPLLEDLPWNIMDILTPLHQAGVTPTIAGTPLKEMVERYAAQVSQNKKTAEVPRKIWNSPAFITESPVQYELKIVEALSSESAEKMFAKGKRNNWSLDKILTELSVPKEQKLVLLSYGIEDRKDLIDLLIQNMSYPVVLVNSGTDMYRHIGLPGGSNYREIEIRAEGITPSLKGHAKFSSEKGLGWYRSDDVGSSRRVLEIQSDLFQKAYRLENLSANESGEAFLALMNSRKNWMQFFINSAIQDAKSQNKSEILFPTGKTAEIIQRSEPLYEQFSEEKRQVIYDRYTELEEKYLNPKFPYMFGVGDLLEAGRTAWLSMIDNLVSGLNSKAKRELLPNTGYGEYLNVSAQKSTAKQVEKAEGNIKKTANFYDNDVYKILADTYGHNAVVRKTDANGHEWFALSLDKATGKVFLSPAFLSNNAARLTDEIQKRSNIKFRDFTRTDYDDFLNAYIRPIVREKFAGKVPDEAIAEFMEAVAPDVLAMNAARYNGNDTMIDLNNAAAFYDALKALDNVAFSQKAQKEGGDWWKLRSPFRRTQPLFLANELSAERHIARGDTELFPIFDLENGKIRPGSARAMTVGEMISHVTGLPYQSMALSPSVRDFVLPHEHILQAKDSVVHRLSEARKQALEDAVPFDPKTLAALRENLEAVGGIGTGAIVMPQLRYDTSLKSGALPGARLMLKTDAGEKAIDSRQELADLLRSTVQTGEGIDVDAIAENAASLLWYGRERAMTSEAHKYMAEQIRVMQAQLDEASSENLGDYIAQEVRRAYSYSDKNRQVDIPALIKEMRRVPDAGLALDHLIRVQQDVNTLLEDGVNPWYDLAVRVLNLEAAEDSPEAKAAEAQVRASFEGAMRRLRRIVSPEAPADIRETGQKSLDEVPADENALDLAMEDILEATGFAMDYSVDHFLDRHERDLQHTMMAVDEVFTSAYLRNREKNDLAHAAIVGLLSQASGNQNVWYRQIDVQEIREIAKKSLQQDAKYVSNDEIGVPSGTNVRILMKTASGRHTVINGQWVGIFKTLAKASVPRNADPELRYEAENAPQYLIPRVAVYDPSSNTTHVINIRNVRELIAGSRPGWSHNVKERALLERITGLTYNEQPVLEWLADNAKIRMQYNRPDEKPAISYYINDRQNFARYMKEQTQPINGKDIAFIPELSLPDNLRLALAKWSINAKGFTGKYRYLGGKTKLMAGVGLASVAGAAMFDIGGTLPAAIALGTALSKGVSRYMLASAGNLGAPAYLLLAKQGIWHGLETGTRMIFDRNELRTSEEFQSVQGTMIAKALEQETTFFRSVMGDADIPVGRKGEVYLDRIALFSGLMKANKDLAANHDVRLLVEELRQLGPLAVHSDELERNIETVAPRIARLAEKYNLRFVDNGQDVVAVAKDGTTSSDVEKAQLALGSVALAMMSTGIGQKIVPWAKFLNYRADQLLKGHGVLLATERTGVENAGLAAYLQLREGQKRLKDAFGFDEKLSRNMQLNAVTHFTQLALGDFSKSPFDRSPAGAQVRTFQPFGHNKFLDGTIYLAERKRYADMIRDVVGQDKEFLAAMEREGIPVRGMLMPVPEKELARRAGTGLFMSPRLWQFALSSIFGTALFAAMNRVREWMEDQDRMFNTGDFVASITATVMNMAMDAIMPDEAMEDKYGNTPDSRKKMLAKAHTQDIGAIKQAASPGVAYGAMADLAAFGVAGLYFLHNNKVYADLMKDQGFYTAGSVANASPVTAPLAPVIDVAQQVEKTTRKKK